MDSHVDHRSWLRAALAVFAVGWGANQFAPLLFLYRTDQGLSQSDVTAMFSVYIVGLLPTLLVAGRWSDRNGRRVLMRPVLVLSLVATVCMFFGPQDPLWLYAGRFLAGLLVLNFAIVPVVVYGLSRFVADDQALLLGVLLVLLAPCIDYVIVFSGLAGSAHDRLLAAAPLLMLVQMLLLPA